MIINEEIDGVKWQISQLDENAIHIYKDGEQYVRIAVKRKLDPKELEKVLHLYQLEMY